MVSDANLPYDGTEGYSGTDTSEASARRRATDAAKRQARVENIAKKLGYNGITVQELRSVDWIEHHGIASSTLTVLHMAGRLVRLAEKRGGCKVYVHPDFVGQRLTEPYKARKKVVEPEVDAKAVQIATLRAVLDTLGKHAAKASPKEYPGLASASQIIHLYLSPLTAED